jgi:hypothetical protein
MQTTALSRRRVSRLERTLWLAASLVLLPVGARADTDEADVVYRDAGPLRVTRQERPFVFVTDPSTPSAGVTSLGYAFGLSSGVAADRPLPVSLASATGSHTVMASYGVTDGLAPFVSAVFSDSGSTTSTSNVTAGLTWQISRPGAPYRASLVAAGIHEGTSGANGFQILATGSIDEGPLRVAANVRADKLMARGRDRLDTFAMAGASLKVAGPLRLGVEYVGQDLEGMFSADAEGGARHSLGPSLSADLDGGRYQLAVGTGLGFGAGAPQAIVRGTFAFAF